MSPIRTAAMALTLTLGAMAAAAAGQARKPAAVVVIDKLAFAGDPPGLHVGDIVEWANHDIFQHSVTGQGFDLDLKPGADGRLVLTKAGTVPYVCRYHPGMKGRIVIAP
jgi:plastocyanin